MVIIFLVSAINFRILSCNNYNPNIYCLNISTDFVPHLTAHLLLGFSTVTCLSAPNQPGSHCHLSCIFAVAPSSHFWGEQHFVHTYKKHVHSPSFYSQIIHSLKGGRANSALCMDKWGSSREWPQMPFPELCPDLPPELTKLLFLFQGLSSKIPTE